MVFFLTSIGILRGTGSPVNRAVANCANRLGLEEPDPEWIFRAQQA